MVARGWSEEDKRAYRLADNQLAARAGWDLDLLRNELHALGSADFDLGLIGFEPDQLESVLRGLGSSGLTDPDRVPAVPDQPITRPGDIWLLGDHRVGCGDSTSRACVDGPVGARVSGKRNSDAVRLRSCVRPVCRGRRPLAQMGSVIHSQTDERPCWPPPYTGYVDPRTDRSASFPRALPPRQTSDQATPGRGW